MYPKNAASPEAIAIGAVVNITTGAVETSGVAVKHIQGVTETDVTSSGTTAYSADGVVMYTPIQSETNYASFRLIASKTGCIPASVTIVTTSSSEPGTVTLADGAHGGTAATITAMFNKARRR